MDSLSFDLRATSLREINQFLHQQLPGHPAQQVQILHPDGAHNIAVGIDAPVAVEIMGHAGYYAAGMNQQATVTVHGNAGTGVAENMMSGRVHVKGLCFQFRWRVSAWRLAGNRRQCLATLWYFAQGCGYRRRWRCRQLLRLHGAGRAPGGMRRCR